jgi:hypothetical protein
MRGTEITFDDFLLKALEGGRPATVNEAMSEQILGLSRLC